MKEVRIENMHLSDTIEELVLEKSERDKLLGKKDLFEEFAKLRRIPDKCCKITDSYEQITLSFAMKSDLRDDLSQQFSLLYHASGFCALEVEFKTPRLMSFKGEKENAFKYDEIAREYSTKDVVITKSDLPKGSDSVIWNAVIGLEEAELDAGIVSDALEKLRSAASDFTRVMEIEFWNAFNKSQVSSFTTDPDNFLPDFSADYEVYEEDTFLGTRAFVNVDTDFSTREIILEKHRDYVAVECVENIEFNDKPKKHTYIFEPDAADGFVIKERFFIDDEEEDHIAGEISRVSDNALCCCLTGSLCKNIVEESVIIVSYDSDAIRAFLSPDMLIATIEKTEEKVSFEKNNSVYAVHTEQFFTGYMSLITALPYLNFSSAE